MTLLTRFILSLLLVLVSASTALGQLVAAKDGPIVYGHHHVSAANVDEEKKFFVAALGGVLLKVGTGNTEIVKFPNVFIWFRAQAPSGGSRGTTVNHVGFSVPDLRPVVERIKANGFQMITSTEAPTNRVVKDDIAGAPPEGGNALAFALTPGGTKVELVEIKTQALPMTLHHVHFFGQQNLDMRAWYIKVFGAVERNGGPFPAADLPGVALNFSPSPDPVVGTQGRAIDHIGFEIRNLLEFTQRLQAMGITLERPYTKVEALGTVIAYVRDPWGTYIELTEGLDKFN
ncbi:MAG: VOC family protein [Vicinamibacterales bacterium]